MQSARPCAHAPLLALLLATLAAPLPAQECPDLYEQARKTRETAISETAVARCGALAERGDAAGHYHLGMLKIGAIGTPGDTEGGLALVRRAAENGYAPAQSRLGRMHLRGDIVENDPALAAQWFERAARAGDPLAQYELGQLRYKGQGVEADIYEAYKWFSAAAENFARRGHVPRQKLAERKRETVAAELPAEERARAEGWIASEPGILQGG